MLLKLKIIFFILKEAPLNMLDYPSIRSQLNTSIKLKKILVTEEITQHIEIQHV